MGWKAKRHTDLIDLDEVGRYMPADFWEPIARPSTGGVILNPDDFYILASKESVRIPPDHALRWWRTTRWSASFGRITRASSIPASGMTKPVAAARVRSSKSAPMTCRS